MKRELEPFEKIEQSIFKRFRKSLWTPFIHAVNLDTFPGYKSRGEERSFLDRYDEH